MKKAIFVVLTLAMLIGGTNVFAQGKYGADSTNCIKYLSYYKEYFKQKNYDAALPNWREAMKICPPTASQNLLLDGATLVRREITRNAKNAEYRAALVDTLLMLHDLRVEYYPKYATVALNNKGTDISNYIKNDSQRLYDSYKAIIDANGAQTKPAILLFEMNAAIDLFQNGKLTAEDIINIYQGNIALIDTMNPSSDLEAQQTAKIKSDLESLFITSKVASCENLIELFTPRYAANPEDLELATNIVKMLSSVENCTDNDLYLKSVTTMYKLNPSYTSAYFLYKLNSARGNVQEAIKYLEEAIAYPESDNAVDGDYSFELAAYCYKNGMTGKAVDLANKAAGLNSSCAGKAYLLLGTIWGSTSCKGNEIETRAPYWVAIDYLQKAKAADSSLTEDADALIVTFRRYFPQTSEAFMYDLKDGQSYTVNCNGMRATTTVRTQK